VSLPGVGSFERSLVPPPPERLAAIITALEAAGVEFTDEAPGARLKASETKGEADDAPCERSKEKPPECG
jgi:hypothetical protein